VGDGAGMAEGEGETTASEAVRSPLPQNVQKQASATAAINKISDNRYRFL